MKVTLKLYTSKVLSNGESPIIIELNDKGKRKKVSTGESAKPSNWLASGKVGCRDPKSDEKNKAVKELYDIIYNRCDECYNTLGSYDFKLICDLTKPITKEDTITNDDIVKFTDFYDLLDYKSQTQKPTSQKNFKQLKNYLISVYGDSLPMRNINQRWIEVFQSKLAEEKSIAQQAKLSKYFMIVFNFGRDNDLIDNRKVSIDRKRVVYKVKGKEALSPLALKQMYILLYEVLISHTPSTDYELTYMMHHPCNGIMVYMLDLFFQGLAPVDLANLKWGDLEIKSKLENKLKAMQPNETIKYFEGCSKEEVRVKLKKLKENDIKYITIPNGLFRQKTSSEVQIVIPLTKELESLLEFFKYKKDGSLKREDDYIVNILDKDKARTAKQQVERVSNCVTFLKEGMLRAMAKEDIPENIMKEFENMSLYTMRHTFVTVGLRLGIDKEQLANMAGHSVDEQATYFDGFHENTILENNLKIYNSLKD
ncbi:hypothetical protein [Prevotella sp.]|uniref:hypothetical protein n=1 Tax=Prevotella sp. TaxID=59823 RepID=UPI002F927DF0